MNTADSLSATTVFADMTEPAGTGYAAYTLSGTWASTNGQVTYDDGSPDDYIFENTGGSTWTGGDVQGAWLTDGVYVLHFKDLANPKEFVPGAQLQIDISSLLS